MNQSNSPAHSTSSKNMSESMMIKIQLKDLLEEPVLDQMQTDQINNINNNIIKSDNDISPHDHQHKKIIQEMTQQIHQDVSVIFNLSEQLSSYQNKCLSLRLKYEMTKLESKAKIDEIEKTSSAQTIAMEEQMEKVLNELEDFTEKKKETDEKIEKYEDEISSLKDKVKDLEEVVANNRRRDNIYQLALGLRADDLCWLVDQIHQYQKNFVKEYRKEQNKGETKNIISEQNLKQFDAELRMHTPYSYHYEDNEDSGIDEQFPTYGSNINLQNYYPYYPQNQYTHQSVPHQFHYNQMIRYPNPNNSYSNQFQMMNSYGYHNNSQGMYSSNHVIRNNSFSYQGANSTTQDED